LEFSILEKRMTFDILFKKYEFLFWKIGLEVGLW